MIAAGVIEVAGVALLHSAWQSTVIAISAQLLLRTIPLGNSRLRYRVGIAALIVMVILPVYSTFRPASVQRSLPVPAAVTTPSLATPVAESTFGENEPTGNRTPESVGAMAPPNFVVRGLTMLVFPLGVLWLIGVSARLGLLAAAAYRVRRSLARADQVVDQRALAALRDACEACGVAVGSVQLRMAVNNGGPAIVGLIRPSIIIPRALLAALPDDALRALFIHELAHLRRLDLLVNPLLQLVNAAFFFHPVARGLVAIVERERERCCDDEVIATGVAPDRYVATLVDVASLTPRPARLTMSATSGGELFQRAERLLKPSLSAASLWFYVRYRAGALISGWAALAVVIPVSIQGLPDKASRNDLSNRIHASVDSADREHWIAFAVPLTTVPLSDEERPHSGWGAMVAMGAPAVAYRSPSITNERLVIVMRLAPRSGADVRATAVAFRTAVDGAAVLPPSLTYLGEVTDTESAHSIAHFAREAPASTRKELVAALALHADPVAAQVLETAVTRDPATDVRAEAVRWLRYRPPTESVPLLRMALNDPHPDVWDEAITTLRRMSDPRGKALLEEAARTSALASFRQEAAAAISR